MKSNSIPQLLLAATLLLALCTRHAVAQNSDVQAITTAVPFLMISPDARSGGLGEAGAAIADNANATHWNLSALAFTDKKFGASMSYTPWLRGLGVPDINLSYLSGHVNLGERAGVLASSIRYFSLGKIEFTDDNGIRYGAFNANEIAFDAGYTRKVTDNFSAGVALRFIYSNLGLESVPGDYQAKPGTAVAGDLNMLYTKDFSSGKLPMNFRWGLNLSNMGSKISYSNSGNRNFIPANMRLGAALKTQLDDYNSVTVTADANKLMVPSEGGQSDKTLLDGMFSSFGDAPGGFTEEMKEINLSAGLEYWYNELFAARAGVFLEDATKGNRKYLTLGAGFKYSAVSLDFAYLATLQQAHPLQNTLRFTLGLALDPAGNR